MNDNNQILEMNSVEAVLRLLMFTVYADRIQKPEEMTELWRQIPSLNVFTDGDFFPGIKDLNSLISKHDSDVRELMDDASLMTEIERAIGLIDSPILAPMVLAGMQAVALSDGYYHHSENNIIEQAAKAWGMSL
jgi:hypothetical protein